MKGMTVAIAVLTLPGCAARYAEPALSPEHPANPAAAEGAWPPASRTLDPAAADPLMPSGGVPADHAGHGVAGAAPPEGGGKQPAPHEHPPAAAAVYTCPMHPEVTSDKPDQRCPKCGMRLVAKDRTGGPP